MAASSASQLPDLSWYRSDPEQRIFFRGGRFTRVNNWCSLLIGVLLTLGFYGILFPLQGTLVADSFLHRGLIPYFIAFFFFWSVAILLLKWQKLRLQRKALRVAIIPEAMDFVLSPRTVDDVMRQMYLQIEDPSHFLLFNRILTSLSNLRNLGRVTDVDEILRSQATTEESAMETTYSIIQGFLWAIPVLGFIGTVEGLSVAIGGFGSVLAAANELSAIKDSLKDVTAGLSVAFETTMQGLVAALMLQLCVTALKKSEEEFMDECSEYCTRNIVGRLRMTPFEVTGDS